MKVFLKLISLIGLLLTIVPAFLVFAGVIDLAQHKIIMFIGTCAWFASAPFWIGKQAQQSTE